MSEKLGFYLDQSVCTGCKACQVACKDKHDLPVGVTWRRVVEYTGGSWQQDGDTMVPNVFSYYTSLACNHCEDALCIEVCPSQAMHRTDNGMNIRVLNLSVGTDSNQPYLLDPLAPGVHPLPPAMDAWVLETWRQSWPAR